MQMIGTSREYQVYGFSDHCRQLILLYAEFQLMTHLCHLTQGLISRTL